MSTCSKTLLQAMEEIKEQKVKAQILTLDIEAAYKSVLTDSIYEITKCIFLAQTFLTL